MNLKNLTLRDDAGGIEVQALGLWWDLHGILTFQGMDLDVAHGRLTMNWEGEPNATNIDGHWENNPFGYTGCSLLFTSVTVCQVLTGGEQNPLGENTSLEELLKVRPGSEAYRYRVASGPGPFHLVFEFRSGLSIEVAAAEVELLGHRTAAS